VSQCSDEHCVTCSDEAVPVRVVEVLARGLAVCVDGDGAQSEVMLDLVAEPVEGDRLLVHAGVALAVIENAERFR
jgi:hydrogenase maturation factor